MWRLLIRWRVTDVTNASLSSTCALIMKSVSAPTKSNYYRLRYTLLACHFKINKTPQLWDSTNRLPDSFYLYLDFHFFHDKAKRTQQGNLLGQHWAFCLPTSLAGGQENHLRSK